MEVKLQIHGDQFSFDLFDNQIQAGYLSGKISGNVVIAEHTIVFEQYQGRGLADKLYSSLIEFIELNNYKLHPVCSYVIKKASQDEKIKNLII